LVWLPYAKESIIKLYDIRFNTIPERDRQTDRQTDRIAISISRVYIAVLTRDNKALCGGVFMIFSKQEFNKRRAYV